MRIGVADFRNIASISCHAFANFDWENRVSIEAKAYGLWKQASGIRIFANENQALTELFCAGVGYGTLTKEIAEPFLNSGRLIVLNGGQSMQDSAILAWYPRREMPAYFRDLVAAIR